MDHLAVLTDDVGIVQHALYSSPNRKTGYCTDDVARAFIVALEHLRLSPNDRQSQRFASTYLAFLAARAARRWPLPQLHGVRPALVR